MRAAEMPTNFAASVHEALRLWTKTPSVGSTLANLI